MRLLICEDNKLVIKTLTVVLERDGFEVVVAQDGNIAYDMLHNNVFDLVIIDIHLPFRSGLEIIKFLRSDLKLKTPVIVLSAFSDPEIQRQAGELEIEEYMVKPFNPSDLTLKIRAILGMNL